MNSFEIKLNSDSEFNNIKKKLYSQLFRQNPNAKVWRGGEPFASCATLVLLTAIPCKLMSSNIDNKNFIIQSFSFIAGIPICAAFVANMIPFIVVDFVIEEIASFVINRFVKFEPPMVTFRFTRYILSVPNVPNVPNDDEESPKSQPQVDEKSPKNQSQVDSVVNNIDSQQLQMSNIPYEIKSPFDS